MSDEINQKTRQPSFLSGYGGGQPVYTPIRIVPEELVAIIEEDISLDEKEERLRQLQQNEIALCE